MNSTDNTALTDMYMIYESLRLTLPYLVINILGIIFGLGELFGLTK